MKLFDDTTNRSSDADEYVPGQNAQGSYQNNPLDDSDSYQSSNPRTTPSDDEDSGYQSPNIQGQQDPEFQAHLNNKQRGGLAQQAGRSFGRARTENKKNVSKIIQDLTSDHQPISHGGQLSQSDRLQNRAKDSLKKFARDTYGSNYKKGQSNLSNSESTKDGTTKSSSAALGDKIKQSMGKGGSSDPTQMAADLADEYLHLGAKMGTILWVIWLASAIIGAIPFVITAIPGILMVNLLLISPKWNYKITVWILDFFGIGEFLTAANKYGLDKVKITVAGWQKGVIVAYDIIFIIILIAAFAIVVALIGWWVCTENSYIPGGGQGVLAQTALKVFDWWYDTNYTGAVKDMCDAVKSVTGAF